MSEETLRLFLENLRVAEGSTEHFTMDPAQAFARLGWQHSVEPGLWIVKWIQGAVAAGAVAVDIAFTRNSLEIHCYGDFVIDVRQLVKQLLGGQIPSHRSERHWVAALHGVCGEPLESLTLASRQGTNRQLVTFRNGTLSTEEEQTDPGPRALSLQLTLASSSRIWNLRSRWTPVELALTTRLRYCHVPIRVGKTLVSRQSPFAHGALLNWIEPATDGLAEAFTLHGNSEQIIAPSLLQLPGDTSPELVRSSLMVTLHRSRIKRGSVDVFWIRDGALIGPIRANVPVSVIRLEVICPGDHPKVNLSEWAIQDPSSFFPDQKILEISRQLVLGLESLIVNLSERHDEATRHPFLFFSSSATADGRLLRALEGPVLGALRGFSQRTHLELMT